MIRIARERGVSGYVGEGTNRWPAGHVLDVAQLYRLALEKAPAGAQLFAAAEEGIAVRRIAETIGRHLGRAGGQASRRSRPRSTSAASRSPPWTSRCPMRRLGNCWAGSRPQPGLIADLDEGHYFGE